MLPLLILRLVIAGALLYAAYNFYWAMVHAAVLRKVRRLAQERGDMSGLPLFQLAFPEWPADKLRHVYYALQDMVSTEDFPLFPEDNLNELGLYDKDIAAMMKISIEKYGGNYDLIQKNLVTQPVQTARDVVNWVGTATSSSAQHHEET